MSTIEDQRALRYREREAARAQRAAPSRRAGLLSTAAGRALAGAVTALAVATVAGLVALWPHATHRPLETGAMGGRTSAATIVATSSVSCPGPVAQRCRRVTARLASGARTAITLGPVRSTPAYGVGSRVRVQRVEIRPGSRGVEPYALAGYDRRRELVAVGIAFVVLLLAIARVRGLLALGGLLLSLVL